MKPEQTTVAFNVVALAAALAILRYFRSILWPFAAACVVAIVIHTLVARIVRLWPRAPRWTTLLVASSVIGVVLVAELGVIVAGAQRMAEEWPQVSLRIDQLLAQTSAMLHLKETLSLHAMLDRVDLASLASSVLAQINEGGSGLVLMLLFLAFLLASRDVAEEKIRSMFSAESSKRFMSFLERTAKGVDAYVWTQGVYGVIVAAASGLVFVVVGLHNAFFWMLALFMLAFLPMVGVVIGGFAPALFALVQFPTLTPALVIAISVQAIAFVAGNIIMPKVVARSVNIDPVASLLALGVWGLLWGVPGAFLALPLTLIVMYQCAEQPRLRWIAVLISSDGHPLPELAPLREVGSQPRKAGPQ